MGDPSPQAKTANKNNGSKGKSNRPLKKTTNKGKFEDLAIQGTNNSSIASKLSVERIYFQKLKTNVSIDNEEEVIPYFKWFVGKAIRRSPCINRGYWLRLEAIRSRLLDIISKNDKKRICVINLGCGFDPLPFEILDSRNSDEIAQYNHKNGKPISFVDIDYPDLIAVKQKLIKNNEYLQEIADANGENYKMVTCDLNVASDYASLLQKETPQDDDCIKVFIAEVSLAYMKPDLADKIILASSKLVNSHFIMMEQLMPEGPDEPFARQMLKHFKKNESPLQTVLTYQTTKQQMQRFNMHGWNNINCGDMYELWENLPVEVKQGVEDVEPFDELEEFSLFAHSYIIMHATNNPSYLFADNFKQPMGESIQDHDFAKTDATEVQFQWEDTNLERKFGACSSDGMYFGGYSNSRLNDVFDTNVGETLPCKSESLPQGRVYHTFTKISDSKYLLIGGRTAPNKVLSDCWIWENNEWTKCSHELPEPLYRHSVMMLANGDCLVLTGHGAAHHYLWNIETGFAAVDCDLPHLNSPAVCSAGNSGHLIGGETITGEFSAMLYDFEYQPELQRVDITNSTASPLFKRYAAKCLLKDNDTVVLVGGISNRFVFGQDSTIVMIKNGVPSLLEIPDNIWNESMVMCGFEFISTDRNKYTLLAGGAVCYGFGSIWNNKKLVFEFSE